MVARVGIHTLELSWELTANPVLFQQLQQQLKRKGGKNWQGQYAREGISRVFFIQAPEGRPYRALHLQVDPAVIFGNAPFSITSVDQVRVFLVSWITKWLEAHYGSLPFKYPPSWKVYRLDVACDLSLKEGEAAAYIQLARQAAVPQGMRAMGEGNEAWNSYRIVNKLETFQMYRKDLQLQEKSKNAAGYENVLRIERQLENKRLNEVKERYHLCDKTIQEICCQAIVDELLYERLASVFGELPSFVTVSGAEQAVLCEEGMTKSKRQKLTELLHDLSPENGGLRTLKNSEKMSSNTFRKRIAWMTEKGISPLLLKENSKTVTLANPLSLISWNWLDARMDMPESTQNACDARQSDRETVGSSAEMIMEVVGAELLSSLSPEPTVTVLSAAGRTTCLAAWLAHGGQALKRLAEPVQTGSRWGLAKGQERFTLDPSGASGV